MGLKTMITQSRQVAKMFQGDLVSPLRDFKGTDLGYVSEAGFSRVLLNTVTAAVGDR
jgi:hypothetical protein